MSGDVKNPGSHWPRSLIIKLSLILNLVLLKDNDKSQKISRSLVPLRRPSLPRLTTRRWVCGIPGTFSAGKSHGVLVGAFAEFPPHAGRQRDSGFAETIAQAVSGCQRLFPALMLLLAD